MAEEAATAPVVEAPAPAVPAATEPVPAVETNGAAAVVPKEDEEATDMPATTRMSAPDGEAISASSAAHTAPAAGLPEQQAPHNKKEKRKSMGGVPEHKNKKLTKKKSMPSLHLDCKPGDYYWAKLKGYPAWPSIICDEQMLPESLLASRPVSTARPDGSIRDDFLEGGKNAKERTFPVMFLATNEFTWIGNTSLEPLDPEQCKEKPKAKMTKDLSSAWQIAAEGHDLAYFKDILKTWQEEEARFEKEAREEEERRAKEAEERAEEEAKAAAAEETKEKKAKKPRKSKGGDDDVDMADADGPKSAKKRKKEAESDAEGMPKKTPKVTKLNAPKTPNGESSSKKSTAKPKKKVVQAPKEEEEVEKEQLTEAQEHERREKAILYLRHRLQKGFLSSSAPQGADLEAMAGFFSQLEGHHDLEPSIIRATKVHKVLKAIIKLSSIPKDEEYNWKQRSAALLEIWNKRMEADRDAAPPSATEPTAPTSLPVVGGEKEESAVPETNGETPAASTDPIVSEMTKIEDEAKGGAQDPGEVVEKMAEEAALQLDEKVEEVAVEEDEKPVTAPAETKVVEMVEAAPEEPAAAEPSAPVEATT